MSKEKAVADAKPPLTVERFQDLVRQHAPEDEQEDMLTWLGVSDLLAGAALSFICSDEGEDAGDSQALRDMREAAMANGGDVGEQWCTLRPCEHHDHEDE